MVTGLKSKISSVSIPVTLDQIAESLRRLSRSELETLELLLDQGAVKSIENGSREIKRRKLKEL